MLSFGTKNLHCIYVVMLCYILVMDDAGVSTERLHYQHVTGTDWGEKNNWPSFYLDSSSCKVMVLKNVLKMYWN